MNEEFNAPRDVKEIFKNISPGIQNYLIIAQRLSKSQKHFYIGLEHVLAAFLSENKSLLRKFLAEEKANWKKKVQELLVKAYNPQKKQQVWEGFLVTPRLQKIWHEAIQKTRFKDVADVGEALILLQMLQDDEGFPVRWLRSEVYNVEELIKKSKQAAFPGSEESEPESPAAPKDAEKTPPKQPVKQRPTVEIEPAHGMPRSEQPTLDNIFKSSEGEKRAAIEETIVLRGSAVQELLAARKLQAEKEEAIQVGPKKYQIKFLREKGIGEAVVDKLKTMGKAYGQLPATLVIGNKEFSFDELLDLGLADDEFIEFLSISEEGLITGSMSPQPAMLKSKPSGDGSFAARLGHNASSIEKPFDIGIGFAKEHDEKEQIVGVYQTRELAPEMLKSIMDQNSRQKPGFTETARMEPPAAAPQGSFGGIHVEPWKKEAEPQKSQGYDPFGLMSQPPGELTKNAPAARPQPAQSQGYDPFGLMSQTPGELVKNAPAAKPQPAQSQGYDPFGLMLQTPGELVKNAPAMKPQPVQNQGYDPFGLKSQAAPPQPVQAPAVKPQPVQSQGYDPFGLMSQTPGELVKNVPAAKPQPVQNKGYDPFGLKSQAAPPQPMQVPSVKPQHAQKAFNAPPAVPAAGFFDAAPPPAEIVIPSRPSGFESGPPVQAALQKPQEIVQKPSQPAWAAPVQAQPPAVPSRPEDMPPARVEAGSPPSAGRHAGGRGYEQQGQPHMYGLKKRVGLGELSARMGLAPVNQALQRPRAAESVARAESAVSSAVSQARHSEHDVEIEKSFGDILINIARHGIQEPYPGDLWIPAEGETVAKTILGAQGVVTIISRSQLKAKKLLRYFVREALGGKDSSSGRRHTGLFVLNVDRLKSISYDKAIVVLKRVGEYLGGKRGALLMCFDVDFLVQHVGLRKIFEDLLVYLQGSAVRCICSMRPQEFQKIVTQQQGAKTIFLPFMLKDTTMNEARIFIKQSGAAMEKEFQIRIEPQLLDNAAELAYKFLSTHVFPETIIEALRKASHFKKEEFGGMGLDDLECIDKNDFLYILTDFSKKG